MVARVENGKAQLLTATVYNQLKEDITAGKLAPGKKLVLRDLSARYSVGNMPLREALTQLSFVGMVVRIEGRGFRVAPAGIPEFEELTRARCLSGEIALREAMANGASDWEERIIVTLHRLQKASLSDKAQDSITSPEWETHHRDFHTALISACNSTLICDFCEQLQTRAERFRNIAEVVKYRDAHELDEHKAIADAVLEGDVELSVRLLKEHYSVTLEIVREHGLPSRT